MLLLHKNWFGTNVIRIFEHRFVDTDTRTHTQRHRYLSRVEYCGHKQFTIQMKKQIIIRRNAVPGAIHTHLLFFNRPTLKTAQMIVMWSIQYYVSVIGFVFVCVSQYSILWRIWIKLRAPFLVCWCECVSVYKSIDDSFTIHWGMYDISTTHMSACASVLRIAWATHTLHVNLSVRMVSCENSNTASSINTSSHRYIRW